jgi:hypothetical protein
MPFVDSSGFMFGDGFHYIPIINKEKRENVDG